MGISRSLEREHPFKSPVFDKRTGQYLGVKEISLLQAAYGEKEKYSPDVSILDIYRKEYKAQHRSEFVPAELDEGKTKAERTINARESAIQTPQRSGITFRRKKEKKEGS